MPAAGITPVTVLTGFLGSGKSTLLNALVNEPAFADTAVIINEAGDIPIDHLIVRPAAGEVVVLPGGCACCRVAGDLVRAMRELYYQRSEGRVPDFRRLVIETTGLADPGPLLATLVEMPLVAARYAVAGVVTCVDAEHGAVTLDREAEAVLQAAMADRIVVTKADRVAPEAARALRLRLATLNPRARVLVAEHGRTDFGALLDTGLHRPGGTTPDARGWLGDAQWKSHAPAPSTQGRHDAGIRAFSWTAATPLDADAFDAALEALLDLHGDRILRLKGLVDFRGEPGPLAIHAVRHTLYPPTRLGTWPDGDRRTRLVFITRDLEPAPVARALESFLPLMQPSKERTSHEH